MQGKTKEQVIDRCRQLYAQQQIKKRNIDLLACDDSPVRNIADNRSIEIDAQFDEILMDRHAEVITDESRVSIGKTH